MTKHTLRILAAAITLATGASGVAYAAPAAEPLVIAQAAPATTTTPAATPDRNAPAVGGPRADGPRADGPRGDGPRHGGPRGEHGKGGHHGHHGHHGGPSMMMMLGQLKAKLNLTDAQQTRWNAAESQQRAVGEEMRARRDLHRKQMQEQLAKSGPADFRAMTAQREAEHAAIKPKLDAARDAWLVVYDSLDTNQKQIVTDAFKQRMQRMGKHDRRGEQRGPGMQRGDRAAPAVN
ncbi:Spy/CpxP family protein refolding chaperone [Pigmentiphaga litoralis]|uniref:Spy/CpxP family protein refolding chaperone n=1 Tax=Pigmentiphaga litoralis TaxID=516702 RepID=UPI003B43C0DF